MPHTLIGPEDWRQYPSREFAAWCNQLEGLRSPVLVGTRSSEGVDNLAIFNSMTHIGARPPLVALVFRPLTVERHTYDNLLASGVYTINHVDASFVSQAHATSQKLPKGQSEFESVGLTPLDSSAGVPYVAESRVSLQLRFVEQHFVSANDTIIVIGRVEEFRLAADSMFSQRPLDWSRIGGVVVSGLYNYYRVETHQELGYVED